MTKMVKKNFDSLDAIRSFEKSRIQVVKLGDAEAIRVTNQPGWRWSECVKPFFGTEQLPSEPSDPCDLGTDDVANGRRLRDGVRPGRCGVRSSWGTTRG